ncbi:hypothetical protein D0860_07261 [Hortaea werneckii]|uniref:NADH:ubiquinone oxidoreductase intermediate-associated protein 30 domain-containing protein n=1 Tax=Hortaea werneckii TaxID=91943 RepID=A0A3M7GMT9_HORWE|nr:hypothetical protein D0860_07261 [Hortaea werneckii]
MEDEKMKSLTLFGGNEEWSSDDWTDSDDRVRGGKSQSYLDTDDKAIGRFHGNLDIKTLGGAGFASQRTTGDERKWNLSQYAGIELQVSKGDKKRYTFILKDELLPINPENGREQATISYETDFELPPQTVPGETRDRYVFIPFKSLNPTYRGKLQKDAPPLDTSNVKRMSIMMRSFFGAQEGDFSLSIRAITALSQAPDHEKSPTPSPSPSPVQRKEKTPLPFQTNERQLEAGMVQIPAAHAAEDPQLGRLRIGNSKILEVELRWHKTFLPVVLFALGIFAGYRLANGYDWRQLLQSVTGPCRDLVEKISDYFS